MPGKAAGHGYEVVVRGKAYSRLKISFFLYITLAMGEMARRQWQRPSVLFFFYLLVLIFLVQG